MELESPISPLDETLPIDFSIVYALHSFIATLDGQVCVMRGDYLDLLDDSNSYWWLVKNIKTDEIGYIPADNIESPFERLARLNRQKNSRLVIVNDPTPKFKRKPRLNILFHKHTLLIYDDGETELGFYSDDLDDPLDHDKSKKKSNFLLNLLKKSYKKDEKEVPDILPSEPISVIRIYAGFILLILGNVDLKATFKTVAITKKMSISDLLEAALKKFKISENSNEFYLGVLHMDSLEKRLSETDLVFDILDNLTNLALPGIGDFQKPSPVLKQARKSAVKINDDNIIKIIINKKLNLFDKNYHLMRVFMYDPSDTTGKIRQYKTVGVDSSATVETVLQMSIKKFKHQVEGYEFSLYSVFNNEETLHTNHENIKSILEMGVGSAHDIDFVMRAKWIGVGNTPISKQEQPQVLDQQIENILAHKPAFLEELNPSPSMEFDNSRNLKSDNENDSFVSPHNLSFVNIDVYPSSMNSEPLLTVTSKDSSGSFNNSINKQDAEIIREKSSDSFLHVSKSNTDSTISKLDKSDSISRSILSKDSSFKISRVDDKIPVKPDVSRVDSMRRLKQSNSFKESSGAKPNFRFMEDYLDEIMKDDGNTEKIEFLENCFKKSEDVPKTSESIEYNDSGLSTILRRKSKGSRSSIHSPISRNDSNELKLSRGSYSKSNRASPVKISILAMFDGLEQEIDKIERNDQIINVEQAEGAVSRSEKNLEILVNQAVEVLKLN